MAYEDLCMYCFEDRNGESICPHCGRDSRAAVPQIQMLPGSLVYHDRFLVGRALGQDATGIVYSAFDTKRENKLRLREYLPRDCAERLNDGSVVPIAGMEDDFEMGLKKLRASVEGVEDPAKRHFFFEENGTAYIAQRKSAAGTAAASHHDADDEDGEKRSLRQIGMIVGIAAAVVLIAAIVIISLVNGALKSSNDVTQTPTLGPNEVWTPESSPSPTPYVTPTFGALVDPEQSWMDYTYSGDVDEEFDKQQSAARTPTPKPTVAPENTGYKTVSSKSSAEEIRKLQQALVTLGWLDYNNITGAYDSATRHAVSDFQSYINESVNAAEKLDVDGIAGPKTLQWLYGVQIAKPTPVPTPMVTPKPNDDATVDKDSSKNDIRAVQRKLIALGVMPSGSDDGVYGTTTTAAVKKFQQRVNQLQGWEVLEVSGVVDPLTMAFLNYYVEEWENNKPTSAPTQAPTPTPAATDIPDKEEDGTTVDQGSAPESIAFVQEMLIRVGLLPEGSANGVYNGATLSAVAQFQEWVNQQKKENVLSVTGIADAMTLQYLEYASDRGMTAATPAPTAVPTPTPTSAPTTAPTEAPTDAPDVPEDNVVVDENSPAESIRYVQQMLASVGLLSENGVDGSYGAGTANAVRSFQEFVNQRVGAGTLEVTGVCDAATLGYLEEYSDTGVTVTPTEAPTVTPEPVELSLAIDGQPAVEGDFVAVSGDSIRFAWASTGASSYDVSVTGSDDSVLYDKKNTDRTSGEFVRAQLKEGVVYTISIGAHSAGGGETVWASAQFGIPEEELPDETDAPTTGTVSDIRILVNGAQSDGTMEVTGDRCTLSWGAEGDVAGYYVYVDDANENRIVSKENVQDTEASISAENLTPGMVYTLTVGALPANGTKDDIVWSTATFGVPAAATPAPTEAPTPTPAPEVGVIESVTASANGAQGGVVEITGGSCALSWGAQGDVAGYYVYVDDANENRFVSKENVQDTEATISAENLTPGVVYTLTVGALPVNGEREDIVWTEVQFMVPVAPTEAPTPEPTVAPVSKPEISIEGSAYSQDGVTYLTGSSAIFSWMAEGEVRGYSVYMENSEGKRKELGDTTNTSFTLDLAELQPGVYRIVVGAVPAGAQSSDDTVWNAYVFGIPSAEPEETEAPVVTVPPVDEEDFPVELSSASTSEDIQKVQMKLYELGLLSTNGLTVGTLDAPTLQAIAGFQQRMNELYDMGLPGIDPTNPAVIIDSATLSAIRTATPDSLQAS